MSLNLTSLEKQAFCKILLDIVSSDGILTLEETGYFHQTHELLDISIAEIEESKHLSVLTCLRIIKNLEPSQKTALAVMMIEMIRADGNVHDKELEIFEIVCSGAEISLPDL